MNPTENCSSKKQSLLQLQVEYRTCMKCKLCLTRKQVVFGEGNLDSKLMVIGQCPGADEDTIGRPFQGRAGQDLNDILDEVKIDRKTIYITNSMLCYLKPGIVPPQDCLLACRLRLIREIKIINPLVILTLGKAAAFAVTKKDTTIASGLKPKEFGLFYLVNTYHPSAASYSGDRNILMLIRNSFLEAKRLMNEYKTNQ